MADTLEKNDDIDDQLSERSQAEIDREFGGIASNNPDLAQMGRANGRADAADVPVSSHGQQGPLVDDSGHITSADNVGQKRQQQSGAAGDAAKNAAKQAIMGNEPDRGGKGPFKPGGSGEKPEGAAAKTADAAKDAADVAKDVETIESPTAWVDLAKKAQKHWKGLLVVALIPITMIAIVLFVVFYALNNPADFLAKVASQIGYKESALLVGKGIYNQITKGSVFGMLPGEVDYHGPNTALADPNTPAAKTGSFADKISKIDWNKAQYQTQTVICPYSIHTKEVATADGKTRSVVDYIAGPDGKPAPNADANAVSSCIEQRYPILNTLLRQPETRTINYQVGIHLNYATPQDQLPSGDAAQQDTFFRDKTLTRVQDPDNKVTTDNQDVKDAIQKAEDLLKSGKSPDQITFNDIGYQLKGDGPEAQQVQAMCDFGQVLLTPHNIGESIWSRANGARRAAYKIATLADTGKYHLVSSEENNATINALANWDNSYAYQNEVSNSGSNGQNVDPEAIHNPAIATSQVDPNNQNILSLSGKCQDIKDAGGGILSYLNPSNWSGIFGSILSGGLKGEFPYTKSGNANDKVLGIYKELQSQIVAGSNGYFKSVADVNVQEVILRLIRIGSNVTVSGVEGGPQDFNRQAMGYRQNAFDNMLSMGGRFLTPAEAATSSVVAEATQRKLDKEKGIAWRLFDTQNTRSLASNFMGTLTNPPKVAILKTAKLGLGLISPVNLFKTINDNTSYLAFGETNRAMAATNDVDKYFQLNPTGFTDAELKAYNALDLAKEIENIQANGSDEQKSALTQYDTCFKTEVTNQLFLYGDNLAKSGADKYKADFQYAPDDIKSNLGDPAGPNCAELYSPEPASQGGNRQDLIKKYRMYRYNTQVVNALDYLSDPDVEDPNLNANQGSNGGGLSNNGQHAAGLIWPVPKSMQVTQCYGHNGHPGLDINATLGMDVAAAQSGTVVRATGDGTGGYGNLVVIEHKDKGISTYYAHNQQILVKEGQEVKQGDIISKADSTGNSTGNHVHFEVRTGGKDGKTNNPLDYLPNDGRNLAGCTGAFGQ